MTPAQMQQRSREKVNQVMELAKVLHLRAEARQRVNQKTGFIETVVYWIDDEAYPTDEAKAEAPAEVPAETPAAEAPAEETAPATDEHAA